MSDSLAYEYHELITELKGIINAVLKNPIVQATTHYAQLLGVSGYTMVTVYIDYVHPPTPIQQLLGSALILIGYFGWMTARVSLGNFFTVRPQAKGLVTSGIYRICRHPIYIFSMMYFIGLGVHEQIPMFLLAFGVLLVSYIQMVRSKAESKILHEHYKEEYERYEKNVLV